MAAARAANALLIDLIERDRIAIAGDSEFGTLDVAHGHGTAINTGELGRSVDIHA